MKGEERIEELFRNFLLSPRLRVCRHLVLLFLIVVMVVNMSYISPDINVWGEKRIYLSIHSLFIFIAIFYCNIYWGVSRYLLRNQWGKYILFIVLLSVLLLAFTVLFQYCMITDFTERMDELSFSQFLFVSLASLVNVGLFSMGVSTAVLFRNWLISGEQMSELESATLKSELDLLKNQINPHFLFNMLNNVNVLLKKDPKVASGTLFKLEDLLRYQIGESVKVQVYLHSEIRFLRDFLQLEKIRRDVFEFVITEEGVTGNVMLPPLLFIPFVENAVKYSQDSVEPSYVHISFSVREGRISFLCLNSKPGQGIRKTKTGGLGLKNISRRLELLYPDRYFLEIKDEERMYTVKLEIKENKI